MNPSAPILFFDSGVGGLSVLAPTRALLAQRADRLCRRQRRLSLRHAAARPRSPSRVPALLGRLVERFHPRLAVIACNTASTIALDHVRSALDLPVVGTVPAIKPAAEMSKSRVIGVLGTEATVRQPYVDDLAAKFASDCTILRHGSPELVELAEAKLAGETVTVEAVRRAAQPMFAAPGGERDRHGGPRLHPFPAACRGIARRLPGKSPIVDGGPGIARRIAWLTREPALARRSRRPALPCSPGRRRSAPSLDRARRFGLGEVRTL